MACLFPEKIITGIAILDTLEDWLFPQIEEVSQDSMFQQDGAPPHWHYEVHKLLHDKLPYMTCPFSYGPYGVQFFSLGLGLGQSIYTAKPQNLQELHEPIHIVIDCIASS